jgi:hypothetical protein
VRAFLRRRAADGSSFIELFLVDTCADCPVLSARPPRKLHIAAPPPAGGLSLQGVGGSRAFVRVTTALGLTRTDGGPVTIRGEFAAFTDPAATDLRILGRDVLDIFDVIAGQRPNEALLITGNHQDRIEPT